MSFETKNNPLTRVVRWVRRVGRAFVSRGPGFAAASSNLAFGGVACVTYVSVNSLGLMALVGNIACYAFLGYSTVGVGLLGGVVSKIYDAIPGTSAYTKALVLAVVSMPIFMTATLLPIVPPINKPDGVGVNMTYYAMSAVITMGAAVYAYRLHGTSA